MMNRKIILNIIYITLISFGSQAQKIVDTTQTAQSKMYIIARPDKHNRILLRWTINRAVDWPLANQYGYELTRITVSRDKKMLKKRPVKILGIFKPEPLENWREVIKQNDDAAILAQAIYGEKFDVSGMDELSAIVSLSEEQQQRFTWGMYAAEQDFAVAQKAGLGYIDKEVKPNEMYLYKIKCLIPENIVKVEEGGVYTGLSDYYELPKPIELYAAFDDKVVKLSWDFKSFQKLYNNYIIERSTDGKNFKTLRKTSVTMLNNMDKSKTGRAFYLDTISNGIKYFYRIKGKTAFGEVSPPSDIVSGTGKAHLKHTPQIYYKKYPDDHTVVLKWKFPKEANKDIRSFYLSRSDKIDGKYEIIVPEITPDKRAYTYPKLKSQNYITITAVGINGDKNTSLPAFVQPIDSIPPAPPVHLEGKVNSLGIVTIKWEPNKEKDIFGYRIYRGNNENEEFSQITVSPHRAAVYYDSIGIKNLNSKVYYKITAVDQRYNQSAFSEILALQKPDLIPPSQPVFKSYKITGKGVELVWANSASADVAKHDILRKEKNKAWEVVYTLPQKNDTPAIIRWTDKKTKPGIHYTYAVKATDHSGLVSKASPVLKIETPKKVKKEKIKGFGGEANRKEKYIALYWKTYKEDDVSELVIYKAKNQQKPTILRHLPPKINYVKDKDLSPNNTYTYILRPLYKNGSYGKAVKITIKY